MQLGTRWSAGDEPPARLPDPMRAAIAEAERGLGDAATGLRWTLTWLEGRPVAELDDGTTVRLGPGGAAEIEAPPAD